MSKMQHRGVRVISNILRNIIIPPIFYFVRFFKDQRFLHGLNNKALKPVIGFRAASFIWRGFSFAEKLFSRELTEYSLGKYQNYLRFHYSENGRGYFDYKSLTDEEKISLFGQPAGRLEYFINNFSNVLAYQDGDSFFDVGCGRGQNTKALLDRYGSSPIHGCDISGDAIDVIRLAVKSDNLKLDVLDITDLEIYKSIPENYYDHVVMSHVFSFLTGKNVEETRKLRQLIIGQLVRIARKTVIIIGSSSILSNDEKFVIEQNYRGDFREPIINYFDHIKGTAVIAKSQHSYALIYGNN